MSSSSGLSGISLPLSNFCEDNRPLSASSSSSSNSGSSRGPSEGQGRRQQSMSPKQTPLGRRRRCSSGSSIAQSTNGIQQHRRLLRSWLTSMADLQTVSGLEWLDPDCRTLLKIPWRHGSRSEWTAHEDGALFTAWAQHKGKYGRSRRHKPKDWKRNFRCALNSLPDVKIETTLCKKNGPDAYVVYRFLPAVSRKRDGINCESCSATDVNSQQRDVSFDLKVTRMDDDIQSADTMSSTGNLTDNSDTVDWVPRPVVVHDIPTQQVHTAIPSCERILPPASPTGNPVTWLETSPNFSSIVSTSSAALFRGPTARATCLPLMTRPRSVLPSVSVFSPAGGLYSDTSFSTNTSAPLPVPPSRFRLPDDYTTSVMSTTIGDTTSTPTSVFSPGGLYSDTSFSTNNSVPLPVPPSRFQLPDDYTTSVMSATTGDTIMSTSRYSGTSPASLPLISQPLMISSCSSAQVQAPDRVLPKLPSKANRLVSNGTLPLRLPGASETVVTETPAIADADLPPGKWRQPELSDELDRVLNSMEFCASSHEAAGGNNFHWSILKSHCDALPANTATTTTKLAFPSSPSYGSIAY